MRAIKRAGVPKASHRLADCRGTSVFATLKKEPGPSCRSGLAWSVSSQQRWPAYRLFSGMQHVLKSIVWRAPGTVSWSGTGSPTQFGSDCLRGRYRGAEKRLHAMALESPNNPISSYRRAGLRGGSAHPPAINNNFLEADFWPRLYVVQFSVKPVKRVLDFLGRETASAGCFVAELRFWPHPYCFVTRTPFVLVVSVNPAVWLVNDPLIEPAVRAV